MSSSYPDVEYFRSLEQALHRPEVRRSRDAVGALIADDFAEFGSSGGIYNKAVVVDSLANEGPDKHAALPEMFEFAVRGLAPGVVLITYRSFRQATGQGGASNVLRSSIWKQFGGSWQMLFHQGTPIPKAP